MAGNNYFADVIFHGVGANASGYLGAIGDVNLHITGEVAAIPVPATIWLFGTGLLGLTGFARKRKADRGL